MPNSKHDAHPSWAQPAPSCWPCSCRRKNRPQLALAFAMPFFQQWTGVNAISFFAPQICERLGLMVRLHDTCKPDGLLVRGMPLVHAPPVLMCAGTARCEHVLCQLQAAQALGKGHCLSRYACGVVLAMHGALQQRAEGRYLCPPAVTGVTAFSKAGDEGQLYAALLVNGVQWIATIVTVCIVDKVRQQLRPLWHAYCWSAAGGSYYTCHIVCIVSLSKQGGASESGL